MASDDRFERTLMMKIVYWLRSRVCNIALKDLLCIMKKIIEW